MNEQPQSPETQPATPPETKRYTLKFKIGIVLLVINMPFGYACLGLGAAMAAYTGNKAFWSIVGGVLYAISWGMLGLGIILAGKDGVNLAKECSRKILRRKPTATPPVS